MSCPLIQEVKSQGGEVEQQGGAEGGLWVILAVKILKKNSGVKLWSKEKLVTSISFEQLIGKTETVPKATANTDQVPKRVKKILIRLPSPHTTLPHNVSILGFFVFFKIFIYSFIFTVPSLSWRGTISKTKKIN